MTIKELFTVNHGSKYKRFYSNILIVYAGCGKVVLPCNTLKGFSYHDKVNLNTL